MRVHDAAPSILASRDSLADPLNGGWLTGTYSGHQFWFGNTGGGTLGILCTEDATGDTMALSNWHVWGEGFENGRLIRPSGCCRANAWRFACSPGN